MQTTPIDSKTELQRSAWAIVEEWSRSDWLLPEDGECAALDLGTIDYGLAWELQKALLSERAGGRIRDLLLFAVHPNVITLGRTGKLSHLLISADELQRCGVDLFITDRGGDVTYHGPGQILIYPIIDLHRYHKDIGRYLRNLEAVIIGALADFGINGCRLPGLTGVWVSGEKIASIGVKVGRWVTMHGAALNVNTDLSFFDKIIPCGLRGVKMTSMENLLGIKVAEEGIVNRMIVNFSNLFSVNMEVCRKARYHIKRDLCHR